MNNTRFAAVAVALIVAPFVSYSGQADACALPPAPLDGISPSDGAEDVPTNAVLLFGMDEYIEELALVGPDGERTALALPDVGEDAVLQATLGELAASSTYVVEINGANADIARSITFTTAAGADDDAPAQPSVELLAATKEHADTCGAGGGFPWDAHDEDPLVTADVDVDEPGFVRLFAINDDGSRAEVDVQVVAEPGFVVLHDEYPSVGDRAYEVVFVDLAGRQSEPARHEVHIEEHASGGCTQAGAAAPVIVALGALFRRRRR